MSHSEKVKGSLAPVNRRRKKAQHSHTKGMVLKSKNTCVLACKQTMLGGSCHRHTWDKVVNHCMRLKYAASLRSTCCSESVWFKVQLQMYCPRSHAVFLTVRMTCTASEGSACGLDIGTGPKKTSEECSSSEVLVLWKFIEKWFLVNFR